MEREIQDLYASLKNICSLVKIDPVVFRGFLTGHVLVPVNLRDFKRGRVLYGDISFPPLQLPDSCLFEEAKQIDVILKDRTDVSIPSYLHEIAWLLFFSVLGHRHFLSGVLLGTYFVIPYDSSSGQIYHCSAYCGKSLSQASKDLNHFERLLALMEFARSQEYLRLYKVSHGDIRPQNILWDDSSKRIVVIDFETAEVHTETDEEAGKQRLIRDLQQVVQCLYPPGIHQPPIVACWDGTYPIWQHESRFNPHLALLSLLAGNLVITGGSDAIMFVNFKTLSQSPGFDDYSEETFQDDSLPNIVQEYLNASSQSLIQSSICQIRNATTTL